MTTGNRWTDGPMTAGEMIELALIATDRSQAWLAAITGLTTKHVNQVIRGRVSITMAVARKIEAAIGTPAVVLLTWQAVSEAGANGGES